MSHFLSCIIDASPLLMYLIIDLSCLCGQGRTDYPGLRHNLATPWGCVNTNQSKIPRLGWLSKSHCQTVRKLHLFVDSFNTPIVGGQGYRSGIEHLTKNKKSDAIDGRVMESWTLLRHHVSLKSLATADIPFMWLFPDSIDGSNLILYSGGFHGRENEWSVSIARIPSTQNIPRDNNRTTVFRLICLNLFALRISGSSHYPWIASPPRGFSFGSNWSAR